MPDLLGYLLAEGSCCLGCNGRAPQAPFAAEAEEVGEDLLNLQKTLWPTMMQEAREQKNRKERILVTELRHRAGVPTEVSKFRPHSHKPMFVQDTSSEAAMAISQAMKQMLQDRGMQTTDLCQLELRLGPYMLQTTLLAHGSGGTWDQCQPRVQMTLLTSERRACRLAQGLLVFRSRSVGVPYTRSRVMATASGKAAHRAGNGASNLGCARTCGWRCCSDRPPGDVRHPLQACTSIHAGNSIAFVHVTVSGWCSWWGLHVVGHG